MSAHESLEVDSFLFQLAMRLLGMVKHASWHDHLLSKRETSAGTRRQDQAEEVAMTAWPKKAVTRLSMHHASHKCTSAASQP
jgi:hypothetical protein